MKYPITFYKLFIEHYENKYLRKVKEYEYGECLEDIPYLDNTTKNQKMDIYYPKERNKKPLIINIHGGAYFMGSKERNNIFCSYYANKDVYMVCPNYSLISSRNNITVKDQISEMLSCLKYVVTNKDKLNLDYSDIYIMGDSAGGHIAIMLAIALQNKKLREYYNFDQEFNCDIKGVIATSPMYDLEKLVDVGSKLLFKGGVKTIFSKKYNDKEFLKMNSIKTHLTKELNLPRLLLICSEGDVFKEQSLLFEEALNKLEINHQYYFEKDEKAEHVFHHYWLEKETSVRCNEAILNFIKNNN